MIRFRGQEAYDQACHTVYSWALRSSPPLMFSGHDKGTLLLSPEEALQKVKNGDLSIEHLSCEVPSVWDVLLSAKGERSFLIHPCQNAVLVFNREFGADVGRGLLCFAVHEGIFENVVNWATHTPAIEKNFDLYNFFLNLFPRMLLQKGAWRKDADLSNHAVEIAAELVRIFHLDSGQERSLCEELLTPSSSLLAGEAFLFHGGTILDRILEKVRETLEARFGENGEEMEPLEEVGFPGEDCRKGKEAFLKRVRTALSKVPS